VIDGGLVIYGVDVDVGKSSTSLPAKTKTNVLGWAVFSLRVVALN